MAHTGSGVTGARPKGHGLEILPNEILLKISQHLTAGDISSIFQTNHFFQSLLSPALELLLTNMNTGSLTQLSWAAANGYDRLVLRLLKTGVKPDERGENEPYWAALHHAALHGHLEIVNILLKFGADPNIPREDASGSPNHESGTVTALHLAAYCGHIDIVRALIEHGADVNAYGTWWNTPLHAAITTIYDDKRKFYPYVNDDVRSWDKRARKATEQELYEIANILLQNGAQVNRYLFNKTPLLCAILRQAEKGTDLALIKLLLDAGANICAPRCDWNNTTPLHSAVVWKQPGVVELLLQAGADVNARLRSNGATPLFLSTHRAVTEILRQYGAEDEEEERVIE
ncbi:ankyrin repeat-containing domain protein [Morchella snyderi]|nr:ankyrin repeat-containing domain protein [Morchella snyderi]